MTAPEVRVLREDWADAGLALPFYASDAAAGADILANLPAESRAAGILLKPGERALVPTGIRIELPAGYEAQIRPRSGLALKHGIGIVNAPGTIDADYRGPVGVILVNLGQAEFTVAHGERIAQMVVAPVVRAAFEPVTALGDSARGADGFGSTGRR